MTRVGQIRFDTSKQDKQAKLIRLRFTTCLGGGWVCKMWLKANSAQLSWSWGQVWQCLVGGGSCSFVVVVVVVLVTGVSCKMYLVTSVKQQIAVKVQLQSSHRYLIEHQDKKYLQCLQGVWSKKENPSKEDE